MKNNDCLEYKNISISEELKQFFSRGAIDLLKDCNIITLDDLFKIHSDVEFVEKFTSVRTVSNKELYNEIIGTCKILKCKYLSCDPMIDLNNLENVDIDTAFGFSPRAVRSLKMNKACTISKLLNMYQKNDFSGLYEIRNLGNSTVDEIINKVKIVCDYYKEKTNNDFENDNLFDLFNELKELIEENKKITEKIEFVQLEIEKRLALKGDCSKCIQKKI